jgi:hypothetical protein
MSHAAILNVCSSAYLMITVLSSVKSAYGNSKLTFIICDPVLCSIHYTNTYMV